MKKNKPRIHISVNSVRSLRQSPPNMKHFDWDDEVRGFGAYRTSRGDVIFVYQYRMPHQSARRMTIGSFGELPPVQARDIARELAHQRRKGEDTKSARMFGLLYLKVILNDAKLRGFHLAAAAQNLRKMAKIIPMPQPAMA